MNLYGHIYEIIQTTFIGFILIGIWRLHAVISHRATKHELLNKSVEDSVTEIRRMGNDMARLYKPVSEDLKALIRRVDALERHLGLVKP